MADKIVVLQAGVIEQVGTPMELYHCPQNRFVAGFIGSPAMNFLEVEAQISGKTATVTLPGGDTLKVPLADAHDAFSGPLTLGIRPEHLSYADAKTKTALSVQVRMVERLGAESFAYIRGQGFSLNVKSDGDAQTTQGQDVRIAVKPARVHLFNAQGLTLTKGTG